MTPVFWWSFYNSSIRHWELYKFLLQRFPTLFHLLSPCTLYLSKHRSPAAVFMVPYASLSWIKLFNLLHSSLSQVSSSSSISLNVTLAIHLLSSNLNRHAPLYSSNPLLPHTQPVPHFLSNLLFCQIFPLNCLIIIILSFILMANHTCSDFRFYLIHLPITFFQV